MHCNLLLQDMPDFFNEERMCILIDNNINANLNAQAEEEQLQEEADFKKWCKALDTLDCKCMQKRKEVQEEAEEALHKRQHQELTLNHGGNKTSTTSVLASTTMKAFEKLSPLTGHQWMYLYKMKGCMKCRMPNINHVFKYCKNGYPTKDILNVSQDWKPSIDTSDWYKHWSESSNGKEENQQGTSSGKAAPKLKPIVVTASAWADDDLDNDIDVVFPVSPQGPSAVLSKDSENSQDRSNSDFLIYIQFPSLCCIPNPPVLRSTAQQVMGPETTFDISTSKVMVPRLSADGSNWTTYSECILNTLTSKKLCHHIIGKAPKLANLTEHKGFFFMGKNMLTLLLDKEIAAYKDEVELWEQKEAQVREIIYGSVDQSTFYQVKNEPTAAAVWKKLASIHTIKGAMFETDLLNQLQTSCYVESGDINVCTHLTNLVVIKE
ncbi:hypothetical protein H0H87_000211 [Tephrocybe sp. NHM501043]|nr:hypothetical protein H0H87_000211 [Tephrocybe sp. NHM501043]